MEKQKVLSHIKINHFDAKSGGACEDAAKKSAEQSAERAIASSIRGGFVRGGIFVDYTHESFFFISS